MATYRWKLGGATLCSRNLDSARLDLRAGGPDRLTLVYANDVSGTAPHTVHEILTLTCETLNAAGTVTATETMFYGRVISIKAADSGATSAWNVIAENAWGDLKRIILTQTWKSWDPVNEVLVNRDVPRVLLGMDATGAYLNTGEILTELVDFAADEGATITLGTIAPALDVPPTEVVDTTVDAALRQILAYHPDHVAWIEDGTALNVRPPSALGTVTVDPCTDGFDFESDPQTDEIPGGVVITYERTHNVDGVDVVERIQDEAGPVSGWPPPLRMTIPLAGVNVVTKTQQIETRSLPDEADLTTTLAKNFFKGVVPEIADAANDDLAITGYSIAFADPKLDGYDEDTEEVANPNSRPVDRGTDTIDEFPRMLVSGEVQPWFPGNVKQYDALVKAKLWYKGTNATIKKFVGQGVEISETIQVTNALPKIYRITDEITLAEQPISGLADSYWAAINSSRTEGTLTGTLQGQFLDLRPGRKVVVTGHVATAAPITAATYDLLNDGITATFGASEYLNPKSIAELARAMQRNRPSWKRPEERTEAKADTVSGGPIKEGQKVVAERYSSAGSVRYPRQPWDIRVTNPSGPTVAVECGTVLKDSSDLTDEVTITSGTSTFTVANNDILWLKVTGFDTPTVTLEKGSTWTDYPSAYEITGTGTTTAFTAYRFPLWKFTSTATEDTIQVGASLHALRLAPPTHFLLSLGVWQNGSDWPVTVPFLEPYHRGL